jgi:hypothetical protein
MKGRSTISVLAGLVSIIVTGLLLFPIMLLIVDEYFSLRGGNYSTNDFILDLSGFLWLGIAAIVGGYVASAIATSRTIFHSLITGIAGCAIVLCYVFFAGEAFDPQILFCILSLVLFSIAGGMIQKYFYTRKQKNV